MSAVNVKKQFKACMAFRNQHSNRYGNSCVIWDYTVLPATQQRRRSGYNPSQSWYTINRPQMDERLSWPEPVGVNILLNDHYTMNRKHRERRHPADQEPSKLVPCDTTPWGQKW